MDMDMGIRMLNEMMGALFGKSQLASDDIGNLKRTMIKRVLSEDIEAHDYTRIQKLFEGGHISNARLVDMVDEPRLIAVGFKEMIFSDIVTLLSNKIVSDSALDELFISIYSKKYKKACWIAQSSIRDGIDSTVKKMDDLNRGERFFCLYMLITMDESSDETIWDDEMAAYLRLEAFTESELSADDYKYNMEQYQSLTFSETEDSILLSRQFERFLSKRKGGIVEYLGVGEKEIPDAITDGMNFSTLLMLKKRIICLEW